MQNGEKYVLKETITKDNICVVWKFAYIYKVVGILLFIGKEYKMRQYSFLSQNNMKPYSPKQQFFYNVHRTHNRLQIGKMSVITWAYRTLWIKPHKISY